MSCWGAAPCSEPSRLVPEAQEAIATSRFGHGSPALAHSVTLLYGSSGESMTNRSWIRAIIMKARVLPCLGTCSGWGLLRVTKTFLGIKTRVSTSVCTFPLIRCLQLAFGGVSKHCARA